VRLFTVHADNLAAVSGLESALQTPELGRYVAGAWECNPFVSMTWYVRYPSPSPIRIEHHPGAGRRQIIS
jgi:hypothetical protein